MKLRIERSYVAFATLGTGLLAAALLAGCAVKEDVPAPAPVKQTAPTNAAMKWVSPTGQVQKSGSQEIIEGLTGKTQVDQSTRARDRIEKVNAIKKQQADDMDKALGQ